MSSDVNDLKDYFSYLSHTLGIKTLLLDPRSTEQTVPLLVLVDALSSYSADEKDLLEKMLSALKIPQHQIQIAELSEGVQISALQTLVLCDAPETANSTAVTPTTQITTYSPRVLLKKPQLKKTTWEEMQKIILFFQQPEN
jgi:hypothetical protein